VTYKNRSVKMVLFYIVIDFSPTSTTTNARFACALYPRPEGQSFTALFDKKTEPLRLGITNLYVR
ncbi:hypothetical protein ACLQ9N_11695, partial [Gallibacterium anatis]|uniref:hypothetical protein n=1 Tax=Gallibacterium anatis TaxID=750 RepID=UPI0039FDA38F